MFVEIPWGGVTPLVRKCSEYIPGSFLWKSGHPFPVDNLTFSAQGNSTLPITRQFLCTGCSHLQDNKSGLVVPRPRHIVVTRWADVVTLVQPPSWILWKHIWGCPVQVRDTSSLRKPQERLFQACQILFSKKEFFSRYFFVFSVGFVHFFSK